MYKIILFDLDGTLVDSKEDICVSTNYVRKKLGLKPLSHKKIADYVGSGAPKLLEKALSTTNPRTIEEGLNIFREHYRKHCLDTTVPYAGVVNTLDKLANKKLGVVTNKSQEITEKILKHVKIYRKFDTIIGGDIVAKKPDPAPINLAIKRLDGRREHAIIVGDMPVDIEAGKAAGIATCGVNYGIGRRKQIKTAKPDFIIDSFAELEKIVINY